MTDLIERLDLTSFGEEPSEPVGTASPRTDREGTRRTRPVHVLLAVTLSSSAVLLFAMASGHLHGFRATAAVVAALVQVVAAVAVIARPSRPLFWAAGACNVVIAVLWVGVEGTTGVSAATAVIGVTLSVLAVIVTLALAARPALGTTWLSSTAVLGSILPVAVVALTIGGLFATADAPGAPSTKAAVPPGGAAAALALATTVKVPGENAKTFQSVVAGNETEQSELKKWVPLDPKTQAVLTGQLSQAYQAAMRYPTVSAAKAAGLILAGGMAPGVGAHFQSMSGALKGINPDGTVNPLYPSSWIYASTAPTAPVVGVMYTSLTQNPPAGFAGPNDHWHQHSNVCVQFKNGQITVPFAADQNITPQECTDVHGIFMKKTVWMVHAWVVPGWESPQGVFSHDNLHLYCPGNTDLTNAVGLCNRQS